MPKAGPKFLEKVIKNLNKLVRDLESGKYAKYGFKNPEEARAYAEYIKEKIEQFKKVLERSRTK